MTASETIRVEEDGCLLIFLTFIVVEMLDTNKDSEVDKLELRDFQVRKIKAYSFCCSF